MNDRGGKRFTFASYILRSFFVYNLFRRDLFSLLAKKRSIQIRDFRYRSLVAIYYCFFFLHHKCKWQSQTQNTNANVTKQTKQMLENFHIFIDTCTKLHIRSFPRKIEMCLMCAPYFWFSFSASNISCYPPPVNQYKCTFISLIRFFLSFC